MGIPSPTTMWQANAGVANPTTTWAANSGRIEPHDDVGRALEQSRLALLECSIINLFRILLKKLVFMYLNTYPRGSPSLEAINFISYNSCPDPKP